MNLFKTIAPTAIAEIEFVEVGASGDGATASDPNQMPTMGWDSVANTRW